MARGVNKVILVGNLGADPEVRYMPNGNAVANLSLATSESWQDKQTGERQDRTEWHRIVLFRRLAEIAGEYLRKGAKVYIEGKIRTRKWQDQAGVERYTTEIHADELQMLDRASGDSSANPRAHHQSAPPSQGNFQPNDHFGGMDGGMPPAKSAASAEPANAGNDFDDDIPF